MPSGRFLRRVSAALVLGTVCTADAAAETRFVRRGDNLQAALDAAAPGDVVLLEPGAQFTGNFTLPAKAGTLPIELRTAPSSLLPGAGHRIQPGHAPLLARIRSSNTAAALKTAPRAHHWHVRYLEFGPNLNGYGDIIQIGDGSAAQNTLDRVPHDIVLDHLYVHGDPMVGQKRGIALNGARITIRDSYISDCKAVGQDSQAIAGWNGPGPYVIENNYLEAAGENVLFGGADPSIPGLVADGITFRRNYLSRPLSWRSPIIPVPAGVAAAAGADGAVTPGTHAYRIVARRPVGQGTMGRSDASAEVVVALASPGSVHVTWQPVAGATEYRVYGRAAGAQAQFWTVTTPSFVDHGQAGEAGAVPATPGTVWSVKNVFELKNARNVMVEGNVMEHHWKESQAGYAIVLTPRNSNGSCTWCVVEHVTFEHNVVRHVAAGVNLLGYDVPARPTRQTNHVTFRHNLFHDVGQAFGGTGWFLLIGDEPRNVVFDHNTVAHDGTSLVYAYGGTAADPREMHAVRFTNNAARHGSYGINGQYFAYGTAIITSYFPAATVAGNFMAGAPAARYPAGNLLSGPFDVEFVDAPRRDFRLLPNSRLRGAATDGGDIGAHMERLLATTARVESGTPHLAAPTNLHVVSH